MLPALGSIELSRADARREGREKEESRWELMKLGMICPKYCWYQKAKAQTTQNHVEK